MFQNMDIYTRRAIMSDRGIHDKNHETIEVYRINYDKIFSEKTEELLTNKKVIANNGRCYYCELYVKYLESVVGDVKIKKDGWV